MLVRRLLVCIYYHTRKALAECVFEVSRRQKERYENSLYVLLTQLVEFVTDNDEVSSSNLLESATKLFAK